MRLVLTAAALLALAGGARASDPVGGYMIVDKVVLEPADDPTTIQLWGSFALAKEARGSTYGDPVRGYLYYKVPPGKEALCRKEWSDLKKAAGTGQIIGFGSRVEWAALGKVRKAAERPESPDAYPLANGLVKVSADYDLPGANWPPIRNLLSLPAPRAPADGGAVAPGEVTLVVGNIADKKQTKVKYVFELEEASGAKAAGTVEAGDKETRWAPKLKLKAGEKYTWRVRVTAGEWKGPAATAEFVVKGEK
jgi:hypothetical protein